MECLITPFNQPAAAAVNFLVGYHNIAIKAPTRTKATLTLNWTSGAVTSRTLPVSSTGDNNTTHSDYYIYQFTLPAAADTVASFYVEVDDVDPASQWKYSFTSSQESGFGLSVRARSACAFAILDAPEMGSLSETQSERTTALTGLLTYMGSTLQDGGQIAAARLGMGLSPLRSPRGDTYTYLASLPFFNDDFPLREGIFAWWLPDSTQEFFYVPYRNPRSDDLEFNSVLQYACLRNNPTQAIRLKVVQNLEVITRSRLYTALSGPNNPAYSTIVSAMKAVPAVTSNPTHLGFLGRAFSAVKNWVSKPQNWRRLLSGGADLISKLVPGSAAINLAGKALKAI
jgi:hypothetical protein